MSWCERPPRPGFAALERVDVASGWFAVYRLEPGVFAIHEPWQAQEVSSFLVLGRERALLFDSGLGMAPIRPVVERLTRLPVVVLNSHSHYDHVGGNAEFDDVLAPDSGYARAHEEAGWPQEALTAEVTPEALCAARLPGFEPASYRVRPYRVGGRVADGQVIDLGERRLEVIATPGHSPDSLALVDREAGLLWTGDTFYEGAVWLHFPGTDLPAYARSIERLAALAPRLRRLLPAHDLPLAHPDRLAQLVEAFARVRAGAVEPQPRDGGLVEYPCDGFSFLMRP